LTSAAETGVMGVWWGTNLCASPCTFSTLQLSTTGSAYHILSYILMPHFNVIVLNGGRVRPYSTAMKA